MPLRSRTHDLKMRRLYIAAAIFYLIPVSLLAGALVRSTGNEQESVQTAWRKYCLQAALLVATAATLMSVLFVVSWFHNGGDPHGMGPSPGLWSILGPTSAYMGTASVTLALFGKGKGRFMVIGWAVTLFLVINLIFMLDMQ